jgi:predicted nuclease of predicted toxin-antitoxin system
VKFLVDNQLPPALAKWLVSRGHEAVHVLVIKLADAKDKGVRNYAQTQAFIVITKDEDFSRRAMLPAAEVRVM